MSPEFKLPDLGEGIHEGEIAAVLVSEGSEVSEGQPILEIETDKATVEIPSPFTGTVTELRARQGDVVKVGSVLMVVEDWQTDRQAVAASSVPPADGGAWTDGMQAGGGQTALEASQTVERGRREGRVPASPATRRLARELGVDLRQVPASGPAGLVTAEDVRSFAAGQARSPEAPTTPSTDSRAEAGPAGMEALVPPGGWTVPPLPDFAGWGAVERVPLRSVRRATAAHMALAWSQIPHVNHQESVDVTRLDAFRREHSDAIEALGGKLTLTVFVIKAATAALKDFPRFNASLDLGSQEIVLKHYYHLGVAVDTERGLMVPVVRDVDRKSIVELSVELKEVARRARAGETSLEELQGGTFTVTNIGALGGTGFAPIVNYPEVAILGMGRAQLQPVVVGDQEDYQIVPRLMMPLILAFDHRVLDGADAARFMARIKESLENPDWLWLRV